MPQLASEAFGVPHEALVEQGAFDRFVDLDAMLYVDPHLLQTCQAPEFARAYDRFRQHFAQVLVLIKRAPNRTGVIWATAHNMLTFKEVAGVGLGHSKQGDSGSAIGEHLAQSFLETSAELIQAGIEDPVVFELAGVLQDDFGPDRISDMTISILLPQVIAFTERVAGAVGMPVAAHVIGGHSATVPENPVHGGPLLLIPSDVLRDIPVAEDWDEIDLVALHSAELRERVNEIIGDTWKKATGSNVTKGELREVLLSEPELIEDLLRQYKAKPEVPYDLERDPAGEVRWYRVSRKIAAEVPLDFGVERVNCDNINQVVTTICGHFKQLVENNALYELLYDPDGKPLRERAAQKLFYGIADAYCESKNLDLTAEANGGRGPVDFKISRGYKCRVNVEAKLSTNNLLHGFEKQLPIYDAAEQAYSSVLLVIRVHDSVRNIDRVRDARDELTKEGKASPELVVVDARPTPSASKA